ncbi:hypothetical protein [Roseomonas sp. WA12]
MIQTGARRLEALLDGVEQILSEPGRQGATPRAFFPGEDGEVTSLTLASCGTEATREALAAIVLHHMLELGATQCALAVPLPDEPGYLLLDGHRIGREGVRSVRRIIRLNGACPARSPLRLSA